MAAIQPQNMVETNGVNREKGAWSTPDPSNRENTAHFFVRKTSNSNPRTPLANGNNGIYLNQKPAHNTDPGQTLPTSESDSLLNMYGDSSTSNVNLTSPREDDQIPENMYRPEEHDSDLEKWIHRDKLAKIENEELQAAGFHLTKQAGSRTGRRAQSRDRLKEGSDGTDQNGQWASARDESRPRVSSPIDEGAESSNSRDWDLRTTEEIAASESAQAWKSYGYPVVRKSGSKIPVLTSSPVPIPSERLERDTPLPRKRTFSGSIADDDTYASPKPRARGNSAASQNLLDETESANGTPISASAVRSGLRSTGSSPPTITKSINKVSTIPTASPPNATRKVTPAGARKTSNTHKPRTPSNSNNASPLQHPPSRATDPDRPRTAVNRPEGEAPWIATMYKPDPRLPQDQQIIPTHAKKQHQQQQQQQLQQTHRDGSTSRHPDHGSPSPPHPEFEEKKPSFRHPSPSPSGPTLEMKEEPNAWPLKQMPSVRSSLSGRPGTSGSGTGGYSTMPKVASSPLVSPPMGSLPSPGLANVPQNIVHCSSPQRELDRKKERSCGCCVVM